MEFGTHIHAPLRMNCNNIGDPLTFHLQLLSLSSLLTKILCIEKILKCTVMSLSVSVFVFGKGPEVGGRGL